MCGELKTVDEDKYEIMGLYGERYLNKIPLGGKPEHAVLTGDVDGDGAFNSIDFGLVVEKQFV